jgi:undecaprenyl diphosphate synthase
MDGNGRWAKQRGLTRVHGHKQGVHAVRDVTEACAEMGVKFLTLYTFSTENWNRPALEVNALMHLLIRALKKEASTFHKNNIRLRAIGDISQLPDAARRELEEVIEETAGYTRMTLTLALSYSGRWELIDAMKAIAVRVSEGAISPDAIDEDLISSSLDSSFMPDPDLLIRTGGEQRVSNFLLWQLAYAELHFSPVFWPDFRYLNLLDAIRDFQDRERRFGRVEEVT